MKLPRRNVLHLAAGTATLPRIVKAQSYPTRPVHLAAASAVRVTGAQAVVMRAVLRILAACLCAVSMEGVMPASAQNRMTYFGGPVVAQVKVVPVFWNSGVNAQIQATMPQFFQDAVNSPWYDVLSAYSTTTLPGGTQQTIVRGTGVGGITLKPSHCSGTVNCSLTDAQIQSELQAQITAKILPVPNQNTVYMIFMPPNIQVRNPTGQIGGQAGGFCAYHYTASTTNPAVPYGVILDYFTGPARVGCGSNSTALQNTTQNASLILANAVTNPQIGLVTGNLAAPAAWFNANVGGVADACVPSGVGPTITVSGRTWTVTPLYYQPTNSCRVARP